MVRGFTRRAAILSGLVATACAAPPPYYPLPDGDMPRVPDLDPRIGAIETRIGGRIGVAAQNTADGVWLLRHRIQERFAMCSMFKWLLAAQMLHMGAQTPGLLDQRVRYDAAYLSNLGHAPVTTANLSRGWMTVRELAQAAVEQSDNGAANLLLEAASGPEGLTQFLRAHGDGVTRLDRNEPALNENLPGDARDTTTPLAMAGTMRRFLTTDSALNIESRETLIGWLVASQTGVARLRAGLPAQWRVGDKTGTWIGEHNATTDAAIAWPPGRPPIVIACFLSESVVGLDARNAAHAEIARLVAGALA